jgi:hypothetical protein
MAGVSPAGLVGSTPPPGAAATTTDLRGPATAGPGAPADPVTPDVNGNVPPQSPAEPAGTHKRNQPVVLVLLAVLLVVIGAIVFLAVRGNGSTTATTQPAVTSPSFVATDTALAASINLRLSDLPSGWSQATPAGAAVTPPVPPAAALTQANQALAGCVGAAYPTVAGLFGSSALPGQTSAVRSPSYSNGADPNRQMYSVTTIMRTTAQAQALAAPFNSPNFANCYGAYQNALVSATVPGATAQVQAVTLTAPAGVNAFGYITTLAIPNHGSEVIGQAFMFGGRIDTRLEPTTNGPAISSDDFNPAYNGVVGRIGRALNN